MKNDTFIRREGTSEWMDGAYFQDILSYQYLKAGVRILSLNLRHLQVNVSNSKCQHSIQEEFIKLQRGHLAPHTLNLGTETSL